MPDTAWEMEYVGRRILLGEYALAEPRFDALITNENFLHMSPQCASVPPVREMRAYGADAVYVESCPVEERLPMISRIGDCYRYVANHYNHYFVRIDGTFDDYMARFNSRTRSTLRRKVRRFKELSACSNYFRVYRHPNEMDEFIRYSRVVAEKSFQERLFGEGLPDTEEFRAQLIESARQGGVEGYVLFCGDRPVSYIHGPISYGTIILYDYVGYDPEFSSYSPGTVLQYLAIKHLFDEGRIKLYDLCTGEGPHKSLFANDHQLCADIYYFRGKPRLIAIFFTDFVFRYMTWSVTWILDKLRLKSRTKRFLRSR